VIEIELQRLPHGEGLPAPAYATEGAAGLDVVSAEDLTLAPGKRHAVATGFSIAIPEGYEVQVRPRSGLALKHGITCLNTPGLIDSGYRGELKVLLVNTDPHAGHQIERGERIAQLVVQPVEHVAFEVVDELPADSERGDGGFGHTGR
jgi:dUTP pyrophosphatase